MLHSDGELSYYSQPPKPEAAQAGGDGAVPHYMYWKGKLELLAAAGTAAEEATGPTWHVRDYRCALSLSPPPPPLSLSLSHTHSLSLSLSLLARSLSHSLPSLPFFPSI